MTDNGTQQQSDRGSMKTRLMGKIEHGELHMRSKAVFALRALAIVLLVGITFVISIFLFNYLFFFIRINVLQGRIALLPFIYFFPWGLLAIDVGLLLLVEMLLRQFRFAYRRPMALTLFLLFACSLSAGIALDRAGDINEQLMRRAQEHRLMRPLHELYFHVRHF